MFVRQGRAVLVYRPFRVRMNRSAQPVPLGSPHESGRALKALVGFWGVGLGSYDRGGQTASHRELWRLLKALFQQQAEASPS